MSLLQWCRKICTVLTLVSVLILAVVCSGLTQAAQATTSATGSRVVYEQLERGNGATGQDFDEWVIQTAKGLIQEAYVRGNDKLNVVLTPQARPNQVQPLVRSLIQGFQRSHPNRDLTVLMYSSNKQLILTARVDNGTVKLTLH